MLYLNRGFVEKKEQEEKTNSVTLTKTNEPYVAGKKLFVNFKHRSLLTKRQQSQCLAAIKCLRSGKEPEKFTKTEQLNIDVYKVILMAEAY